MAATPRVDGAARLGGDLTAERRQVAADDVGEGMVHLFGFAGDGICG